MINHDPVMTSKSDYNTTLSTLRIDKKMLMNNHKWSFMTMLWPLTNAWPYHEMTWSQHNNELRMTWSHKYHLMTMIQEGYNHGVMAILWSDIGNAIVMLLSHHIDHIHLILLSWSYHSHPIYIVTYIISWSSYGHARGMP